MNDGIRIHLIHAKPGWDYNLCGVCNYSDSSEKGFRDPRETVVFSPNLNFIFSYFTIFSDINLIHLQTTSQTPLVIVKEREKVSCSYAEPFHRNERKYPIARDYDSWWIVLKNVSFPKPVSLCWIKQNKPPDSKQWGVSCVGHIFRLPQLHKKIFCVHLCL